MSRPSTVGAAGKPAARLSQQPRPRPGRPAGKLTQHRRAEKLRKQLEDHPEGLPLETIARHLGITPRSVRRYLATLTDPRLPDEERLSLERVPGLAGGLVVWRLTRTERGRSLVVRRAQVYGLLASRPVFELLRGSALFDELDNVARQLTRIANRPARSGAHGSTRDVRSDARLEERFLWLPAAARNLSARGEELDDLFNALAERRVTRFTLAGRRHTVHPLALLVHQGALFLVAREEDPENRDSPQVYPFDRLSELGADAHARFELPDDFDARAFHDGDFGVAPPSPRTRVLIEFEASSAERLRGMKVHPSQRTATSPDGRMRLSMSVGNLDELVRWVLGFGSGARVIEPPHLVDHVREVLQRARSRYGG